MYSQSCKGIDMCAGLCLALLLLTTVSGGTLDHLMHWEPGRSMSSSSVCKGADGLPDPNVNKDNIWRVESGQTVTIADLDGQDEICPNHISEAIQYRMMDKYF